MQKEHPVINLEGISLVVSDETAKDGDLVFHTGEIFRFSKSDWDGEGLQFLKPIIGTIYKRLEGLPLIEIVEENEVEAIAQKYSDEAWGSYKNYPYKESGGDLTYGEVSKKDFIAGYKQANKGFVEEQVREAIKMARTPIKSDAVFGNTIHKHLKEDEIIQSLTLPKQIESVVLEYEQYMTDGWRPSYNNPDNSNFEQMAELDYRLKTTTTPEGLSITPISIKYKQ